MHAIEGVLESEASACAVCNVLHKNKTCAMIENPKSSMNRLCSAKARSFAGACIWFIFIIWAHAV